MAPSVGRLSGDSSGAGAAARVRTTLGENPAHGESHASNDWLTDDTGAELKRFFVASLYIIPQKRKQGVRPLRGKKEIGLAVGKVLGHYKMGKHLQLTIEEDHFDWQRKLASIERETSLDGIYVIRASVSASQFTSQQVVATYKSLSTVERAFRSMTRSLPCRISSCKRWWWIC